MARESLNLLRVLSVFLQDPDSERYGTEITEVSGVKAGNLYPILANLEKKGWLESEWENIDESKEKRRRRRYYRITPTGIIGAKAELNSTVKPIAKRMGWVF